MKSGLKKIKNINLTKLFNNKNNLDNFKFRINIIKL